MEEVVTAVAGEEAMEVAGTVGADMAAGEEEEEAGAVAMLRKLRAREMKQNILRSRSSCMCKIYI